MKKNDKKDKIKNKSPLIKSSKVKELENNILSSPKNINSFNKLIELLLEGFENKNEKDIKEIINSVKNILTYYLMDKNIKSSKELISFFENKIELIYKILFDLISNNNNNSLLDESLLLLIFNVFEELINFVSNNKIKYLFQQMLDNLIINKNEISQNISNSFYDKFHSIFYYNYIFECLFDIIKNKKIKNETQFNNFYYFVINIKDLDYLIKDNNIEEEKGVGEEEKEKEEINKLKESYQNIITAMLNEKLLPLSIVIEFMKILNKKIIQNVNNPIIFSDYLIKKTSEIEIKSVNDYDIQIFGLSSLFILLTKYNLDYDKYYELLYKLISKKFNHIIFDSKYKNRILKLIQLSLTSEQIPYVIICSFIKKLLRIALFSKVEIIYSLLSLVMKIIQLQPRTLNLIMDNKSKKILKKNIENNSVFINGGDNTDNLEEIKNCISLDEEEEEENDKKGFDNFDEESLDPFHTNAEHCSLWELYSFTRHYNMGIRKLVNKFSRNFLAKELEMEIKSQKDVYFDIQNLNAHFYINN